MAAFKDWSHESFVNFLSGFRIAKSLDSKGSDDAPPGWPVGIGRLGNTTKNYSVLVNNEMTGSKTASAGLCADCRFKRLIESDRGSIFYLCERSTADASFPKYPRLPVLQCRGYEPQA